MVNKKVVLECINDLMFNGKTISNTEYFKGKPNADKLWAEALTILAKNLMRWSEEKAIGDTMFKEITQDCQSLTGYEHRYISTSLYDEAYKITLERLAEEEKGDSDFEMPPEPSHGLYITPETNLNVVMKWWRRTQIYRGGEIMTYMPTDNELQWLANKLNLNVNKGDDLIVMKCFLNDYKWAKQNGKTLLTKISVVDGKATLSYAG